MFVFHANTQILLLNYIPLVLKIHVLYVQKKTLFIFLCTCTVDEIQKHTLAVCPLPLSLTLAPLYSARFSLSLFPFPLKIVFFIQVVLSHGQHQHLIKTKDKHGPRSTAELISSPGSISQLPSICPNTNLLFFMGKK